MFDRQLGYLTGMISRASQRPGADARNRLSELRDAWEEIESEFHDIQSMREAANN